MTIVFGSPEAQEILQRDRAKARREAADASKAHYGPRLTEAERAALPAYLVSCPKCGGTVGASTAEPDRAKETAAFLARQVRAGLVINHVTVADVRKANWCTCNDQQTLTEVQP